MHHNDGVTFNYLSVNGIFRSATRPQESLAHLGRNWIKKGHRFSISQPETVNIGDF